MNALSTAKLVRILLALLVWSVSSCVVSDGQYQKVSGRDIDPATISELRSGKASVREVIERLGQPAEKRASPGGLVLTYKSLRARTSNERLAGVVVSSSTQEIEETWEPEFSDEKLVEAKKSTRIAERP